MAQHLRLAGANAEAAEQLRRARPITPPRCSRTRTRSSTSTPRWRSATRTPPALHERTGDLRTLTGDYRGALATYEAAAAHCEPERLAAIEHKLGEVHERRGERERAEARLLAALDAAPAEDRALRARIQADLSLTLHRSGRSERAVELAGEARDLAEAAGDRRAQAQAHNMLGMLAWDAGEPRPRGRSWSAASRSPRSSATRRHGRRR